MRYANELAGDTPATTAVKGGTRCPQHVGPAAAPSAIVGIVFGEADPPLAQSALAAVAGAVRNPADATDPTGITDPGYN